MKDGFVRAAACGIEITVADARANGQRIVDAVREAEHDGVNLLCTPELCLTGYSCADLYFSDSLIRAAEAALFEVAEKTADCDVIFSVGLPIRHFSKLYNCAAVLHSGEILGVVAKSAIPSHKDTAEGRYFESGKNIAQYEFHRFSNGTECSIGAELLFSHESMENYVFGVEIGSDSELPIPVSTSLCSKGAKIILNPAATPMTVGALDRVRALLKNSSGRLLCGYVRANAHHTESTQDMVWGSHDLIIDRAEILAESLPFERDSYIVSEIDVDTLARERCTSTLYSESGGAAFIVFSQMVETKILHRHIAENPFVPEDRAELDERCGFIFSVQATGLVKRILHTNAKKLVIGVSGGLDSTLAMLVCVKALDMLSRDRKDLVCVTMPCFGTTERTKSNAEKLCECFGTTFCEVDITDSVRAHFKDIGHDESVHDTTYENCQARERTQVIMDIANKCGGMVIGTGDMSELALGWCTYNGDQMSMYGVNGGVPKTLIRHIVSHEAEKAEDSCQMLLSETLFDILDTPVSPELLPPDESGDILQKTEDIVGPYELHDFFLYYTVRYGMTNEKIYRLALCAYEGVYSDAVIRKWLDVFTRRFFSQQFKRSCMPDGVKVGAVSLSPRGDFRMPSDASAAAFML